MRPAVRRRRHEVFGSGGCHSRWPRAASIRLPQHRTAGAPDGMKPAPGTVTSGTGRDQGRAAGEAARVMPQHRHDCPMRHSRRSRRTRTQAGAAGAVCEPGDHDGRSRRHLSGLPRSLPQTNRAHQPQNRHPAHTDPGSIIWARTSNLPGPCHARSHGRSGALRRANGRYGPRDPALNRLATHTRLTQHPAKRPPSTSGHSLAVPRPRLLSNSIRHCGAEAP